jgi:hypothetical protein
MSKALVNNKYLLQKFPGKGGWTFAAIPEIPQDKRNPFGWVRVKGTIDGYEFKNYHLMPMGNGQLFLPVKAAVRKIIKKKEGDWINVRLFPDNDPVEVPGELLQCLKDEPTAFAQFNKLSDGERIVAIKKIYAVKKDDARSERIVQLINDLLKKR